MSEYVPDPAFDCVYVMSFHQAPMQIGAQMLRPMAFQRGMKASGKRESENKYRARATAYLEERNIPAVLERAGIEWELAELIGNIRRSSIVFRIDTDEQMIAVKLLTNDEVTLTPYHTVLNIRHNRRIKQFSAVAVDHMRAAQREIDTAQTKLDKLRQDYPEAWEQFQAERG